MLQSSWRLPSHVHATVCGLDLVLLDVRRDAYFCLPDVGRDGAPDGAGRFTIALAPAVRAELQAQGLVVQGEGPLGRRRRATAAGDDLFDHPFPAPTFRERWDFARALAIMILVYRGRPFEALLRRAAGRGAHAEAAASVTSAKLVRRSLVFRRLLPWSPVQGVCLFQAALLLEFLRQAGLTADWVFGVRTWPFGAHCWLQAGPTVLNDTVDRVTAFDPILVV